MPDRVCMLTSVHSAFDDRIFHKEAKALAQAGYDVAIIVRNDKRQVVDGIEITPLPQPRSRFERMTKIVGIALWLALRDGARLYHFHDPELLPAGLLLKLCGKKVIYDAHEDVSKQIMSKAWVGTKCARALLALLVGLFERSVASLLDGIVAATPDIAERFPVHKTVVLRNVPILKAIDAGREEKKYAEGVAATEKRFVVVYSGGLTEIRGISILIRAMEYVPDIAVLWLIGGWEDERFRSKCEGLPGWASCSYKGKVPYTQHYSMMARADAGIVTFLPEPNHETALPNKPFEYMGCSLPVIMSNFPHWRKTFDGCAVFVDPAEPEDIADKIRYLMDHVPEAKRLGRQGRKLVEVEYNWEKESGRLTNMYRGLFSEDRSSR